MLSKCAVIQNYGAILKEKFGDPGVCIAHIHMGDGSEVLVVIDGFDHVTVKFPGGDLMPLEGVKNITEIFMAVKREIRLPIKSLDVEVKIAGKSYFRHLPGPPTNPEVLATAYKDIVKELLNA